MFFWLSASTRVVTALNVQHVTASAKASAKETYSALEEAKELVARALHRLG